MSETTDRQLDAIEAQFELLRVQIKALRHSLKPPPVIALELPDRCQERPKTSCALQSEDARISQASLANPQRSLCKGCRVLSEDGRF